MKIQHVVFQNYSGPKVTGNSKYSPNPNVGHWQRVFDVTTSVESGNGYGCIVGYDGTTVTAGLHQAILTYPKELLQEDWNAVDDQGSLVQLLRLFEFIPNFEEYKRLMYEFSLESWYVAPDNKIRYSLGKAIQVGSKLVRVNPGDIVFGSELRNTITPMNGKVPSTGPLWEQSKKWAVLFHNVFNNPVTFSTQIKFGVDHSIHNAKSIKLSNGLTVSQFVYGGDLNKSEPFKDCQELDLAMMLFWCNSVNAPAIAKKCMETAIKQSKFTGYAVGNKQEFGKVLLKILGTMKYGRWDDDVSGGRYQRTRDIMMKMNYWDVKHFAALGVMPKDFRD